MNIDRKDKEARRKLKAQQKREAKQQKRLSKKELLQHGNNSSLPAQPKSAAALDHAAGVLREASGSASNAGSEQR